MVNSLCAAATYFARLQKSKCHSKSTTVRFHAHFLFHISPSSRALLAMCRRFVATASAAATATFQDTIIYDIFCLAHFSINFICDTARDTNYLVILSRCAVHKSANTYSDIIVRCMIYLGSRKISEKTVAAKCTKKLKFIRKWICCFFSLIFGSDSFRWISTWNSRESGLWEPSSVCVTIYVGWTDSRRINNCMSLILIAFALSRISFSSSFRLNCVLQMVNDYM